MPPKGAKPTNDELLAQFDDLGLDPSKQQSDPAAAKPTSATPSISKPEKDPLAELETLASQRPTTPRLSSEARPSRPSSGRPSEDRTTTAGKSEDVGNAARHPTVEEDVSSPVLQEPTATEEVPKSAGGGGWWGGLLSTATATATAAMKQAEAAMKEIQKNEEAQKWADQVRGNVGALREFGKKGRRILDQAYSKWLICCYIRRGIKDHGDTDIYLPHPHSRTTNLVS